MDSSFYRGVTHRFNLVRAFKKFIRNKRAVTFTVIGALVLVYGVLGNHGIVQRVKLQREKAELERKIKAASEETKQLQLESKDLDTNLKAIEKVARERYGMAREGERVYRTSDSAR